MPAPAGNAHVFPECWSIYAQVTPVIVEWLADSHSARVPLARLARASQLRPRCLCLFWQMLPPRCQQTVVSKGLWTKDPAASQKFLMLVGMDVSVLFQLLKYNLPKSHFPPVDFVY